MSRTAMRMLLLGRGDRGGTRNRVERNREQYRYDDYDRTENAYQEYARYQREPDYRYEMERYDTENRFRDRRGRERYDNGRFAPKNSMRYSDEEETRMEYPRPYLVPKQTVGFKGSKDGHMKRGHAESAEFDRETADEWVREMKNMDGSEGPHWNLEQTQQFMRQTGYQGDPDEFYAIMNAMYSDYCAVAKKFGFDRPEVYAHLAKAFLEDEDAVEDKAAMYYRYIVE